MKQPTHTIPLSISELLGVALKKGYKLSKNSVLEDDFFVDLEE